MDDELQEDNPFEGDEDEPLSPRERYRQHRRGPPGERV